MLRPSLLAHLPQNCLPGTGSHSEVSDTVIPRGQEPKLVISARKACALLLNYFPSTHRETSIKCLHFILCKEYTKRHHSIWVEVLWKRGSVHDPTGQTPKQHWGLERTSLWMVSRDDKGQESNMEHLELDVCSNTGCPGCKTRSPSK